MYIASAPILEERLASGPVPHRAYACSSSTAWDDLHALPPTDLDLIWTTMSHPMIQCPNASVALVTRRHHAGIRQLHPLFDCLSGKAEEPTT